MTFERIQHTKLSDVIMARIEAMIVDCTLPAGQRLPAERDLAQQFSVSRPSLREAIQKLEARSNIVGCTLAHIFVRLAQQKL